MQEHEYKSTPIDGFGLALLNNMGFSERGGVGRSLKNQMEKPIQFLPRAPGVGLGAIPKSVLEAKIMNGKKVTYDMRTYCAIGEENGNNNNVFYEGDKVKIVDGKHKGMKGDVTKFNEDSEEVWVKFKNSDKVVKVNVGYIERIKDKSNDFKDDDGELGKRDKPDKVKKEKKDKKEKKVKDRRLKWMEAGIRLRMVNKKYRDGKFYLSVGTITDIISPEEFCFLTENGEIHEE